MNTHSDGLYVNT